jgi:hypothetical protein
MEAAMSLSRRKMIALIGGGAVLAATAPLAAVATRRPQTATRPWMLAGHETEVRRRALSWALLAPNPHNRQPWLADLGNPGEVVLYADPQRLLPVTDPMNRQITIGLGAFLDLMRMAAGHDGHRVEITPFPEGEDAAGLDGRPVARAVFVADAGVKPDPLFAHALARRSVKEPYDTARPVPAAALEDIGRAVTAGSRFGGTVEAAEVEALRSLTHDALRLEFTTPRAMQESIDLFRIGAREVDANPDGIDFSGPVFELMRATGLFSRESAADPSSQAFRAALDMIEGTTMTSMGFVWLVTAGNGRATQLAAGADWLRLNLAVAGLGLAVQPVSQALQEFPEMADLYAAIHDRLAPDGGTVQMLGRIGYGPTVGPSPRWPLETRIL